MVGRLYKRWKCRDDFFRDASYRYCFHILDPADGVIGSNRCSADLHGGGGWCVAEEYGVLHATVSKLMNYFTGAAIWFQMQAGNRKKLMTYGSGGGLRKFPCGKFP